ncbi:NUDIX domain-containing protein [Pelagovum pacificum]|uniref:NUDIX domain-containing protein n=1 Tax=Pelagovum pacificum TaxID=2588711 RepID=UPI0018CCD686|nr:NUDIX hydrolase [Pelagovum pacificum]QQA43157.1 NUDIX hydrolase [Pelagovum pacificum]
MSEAAFHGCKVALFFGDRLLITLRDDRADIPFPAHWDLPGGGREPGETPWQTLAREAEEEVGLDLDRAEVLWRVCRVATHIADAMVWFYVAAMPEGAERDILFGDEGTAWALVPPERIFLLDKVVPSHLSRLEQYRTLVADWGGAVDRAHWD